MKIAIFHVLTIVTKNVTLNDSNMRNINFICYTYFFLSYGNKCTKSLNVWR